MAFLQGQVCLQWFSSSSESMSLSFLQPSCSGKKVFHVIWYRRNVSYDISVNFMKSRLRVLSLLLSPSSAGEAKETPARKRLLLETLGERCMLLGTTRSLHEIAPFFKMSFPHLTDYSILVNSYTFIQSKQQAVTTQYHKKNSLPCQCGISNKERSIVRVSTYNEPYFSLQ